MRTAFLFPGQANDLATCASLAEQVEECAELVRVATKELGVEEDAPWRQGGRLLERTEVYQPVLVALTLGIHARLERYGVRPDVVAGHSLGELSAWAAAGALDARRAIRLAVQRGRLMAEGARAAPGGMLAVHVIDEGARFDMLALALGADAHLAAINSPTEYVLAGSEQALVSVSRRFGGTRLPGAGAWHGPGMARASEHMRAVLEEIDPAGARIPVASSVSGSIADPASARRLLADQLVAPVRWSAVLDTLRAERVDVLVTIGPGRVLRGLARQSSLRGAACHATDSPAALARTIQDLGARA